MTREDFDVIARVIATLPDPHKDSIREIVATAFADELPSVNANFNRALFLSACDVV